jgi:glycosyltransferase involved in cell wall biosynthesis
MKALFIFQLEFPWDIRVEKLTSSLAKRHEVHLLCRNRGKSPSRERYGSVNIHRVGGAGVASIKGFPAFFSPWWIRAGLRIIAEAQIDLIIVRDLPLVPLGMFLGGRSGLPVVFDMAENYPAMIADTWRFRGPKLLDYLLRNPWMLRRLEEFVVPRVDEIWVVSDASKNRIMPAAAGPVRVIGNTPTIDILRPFVAPSESSGELSVIYAGLIDESRGLDVAIQAVSIAAQAGTPFRLKIVGSGSALASLQRQAEVLGISPWIDFCGWMPQSELRAAIASSDIGIVPHRVTEHTNTTLPNKIFDYMALGKPVITSDAEALREVVESYGCGLTFPDGDAVCFQRCIEALRSAETRAGLGRLGQAAIKSKFNWLLDEAILLDAAEKVTKVRYR